MKKFIFALLVLIVSLGSMISYAVKPLGDKLLDASNEDACIEVLYDYGLQDNSALVDQCLDQSY